MYYYEVWVRSARYRGKSALTYQSERLLPVGSVVRVPLQRESVPGLVVKSTAKPPAGVKLKALAAIETIPPLPLQLIELADWLRGYYRAPIGAVTSLLLPAVIPKHVPVAAATQAAKFTLPNLPRLTTEQAAAMQRFKGPDTYMLHGRTGSGKTRIYLELATEQLQSGRSVIVLSPEIGLIAQLADSFRVFGADRVVVLHSGLTPAERFRAWLQIARSDQPLVVIGPRSALFCPLKQIGLIVVDETHEPAYKQEQEPRYHAARAAARLSAIHGAMLVHGSATPPVTEYFVAQQKQKPIIRLLQLAKSGKSAPQLEVVDLKQRDLFTRSAHISDGLISAVADSLEKGEQSLLYLNRRGTARLALCQNCGWQAICPNCDVPLVYHADTYRLQCHICGYQSAVPTSCPVCKHTELVFRSVGTKAIVDEVERLFPEARLMRFDSDNTKAERFEQHYQRLVDGDVDILIGTQTLAKGLDLPKLSTLGVILADTSLYLPDFTASERTYQLLNQVIGRVGRGHRSSRAVIQTYDPSSPIIADALSDNWEEFYQRELSERKLFRYPPFRHLLVIACRRASAKSAEAACEKIKSAIEAQNLSVEIDGPAPATYEKTAGKFTWQLIAKAKQRSQLLTIIDGLPSGTTFDIDPINLL